MHNADLNVHNKRGCAHSDCFESTQHVNCKISLSCRLSALKCDTFSERQFPIVGSVVYAGDPGSVPEKVKGRNFGLCP